jgi:hypothetical protein
MLLIGCKTTKPLPDINNSNSSIKTDLESNAVPKQIGPVDCLADDDCFYSGLPSCEPRRYSFCIGNFQCTNAQIMNSQEDSCILMNWQSDTNGKTINFNETCSIKKSITKKEMELLSIKLESVCDRIKTIEAIPEKYNELINSIYENFAQMKPYYDEYLLADKNNNQEVIDSSLAKIRTKCLDSYRDINDLKSLLKLQDNKETTAQEYEAYNKFGVNIATMRNGALYISKESADIKVCDALSLI